MAQDKDGWELNDAGNIITHPLLEWKTGVMYGAGVLLKTDVSANAATPRKVGGWLQIAMTLGQAKSLIEDLQKMVGLIEAPPTSQPRN